MSSSVKTVEASSNARSISEALQSDTDCVVGVVNNTRMRLKTNENVESTMKNAATGNYIRMDSSGTITADMSTKVEGEPALVVIKHRGVTLVAESDHVQVELKVNPPPWWKVWYWPLYGVMNR